MQFAKANCCFASHANCIGPYFFYQAQVYAISDSFFIRYTYQVYYLVIPGWYIFNEYYSYKN